MENVRVICAFKTSGNSFLNDFLARIDYSNYKRMKIKFFDVEVYDEYKICNELTSQLC